MSSDGMKVTKINGLIGAEIGNVDISQELDEQTIEQIKMALAEHGVIFFRDQDLSAERQRAFGRRFFLPAPTAARALPMRRSP